MIRFFATFLAITICAATVASASEGFSFLWSDDQSQKRIHISFSNQSDHDVCFDPAVWPNDPGSVGLTNLSVELLIDGQKYPMRRLEEYCVGACGEFRIKARSTAYASLRYDAFGMSEQQFGAKKTLVYDLPEPVKC
jgi:hypothetical protein